MCDEECDLDTFLSLMDEYDEAGKEKESGGNHAEARQPSNVTDSNEEDEDVYGDNEEELMALASQQIEESQSQPSSTSNENLKTDSPALVSQSGIPAESDLLAEMRRMQEKIQMLESQLKTQKHPQAPKVSTKSKNQATTALDSTAETQTSEAKPSVRGHATSNSEPANKISFADAIKAATSKSKPNEASTSDLKSKKEKELFGDFEDDDDDDNDWIGLDGERRSELNQSGKDLKRLLEDGGKKRIAHQSNHQLPVTQPTMKSQTSSLEKASTSYITSLMGIPNAPGVTSSYTADNCSLLRTSGTNNENVVKEQYSGIRIINPLISADQMRTLMDNRRMIKLSSLRQKLGGCELEGDWVTMGVLVSKSEQRVSAKGQQYCIWKLSDLTDCDQSPLSMFLFRDVNTTHSKTLAGTVLGFLNPSIMSNKDDKFKNELSLTVDNAKKILPLGISKDLGTCKGRTKTGNTCNNFINISQGDHCSYHVQAAYKKQSSKRSELQNGFSGVAPKFKKEMDKIRNYGQSVSYKNDTFTTKPMPKTAKNISLQSLLNHQKDLAHRGQNDFRKKINTLLLHDLLPNPDDKTSQGQAKGTPEQVKATPGQLKNTPGQNNKTTKEESLKDDKHFHELLLKPTAGSMNFVKYLKNVDGRPAISQNSKKPERIPEVTAEEVFKDLKKKLPLTPKLGRGVDKDGFINLDSPPSIRNTKEALANERAKLNALKKIKELGGLKRQDPNCTTIDRHDKSYQERIKKRLRETEDNDQTSIKSPPAKKSKLLGNVDLNSDEIQKLIKAKSAHANLLSAEEEARQEQYFNVLEKTEKMEEKMINTKEIKVDAFTCFKCKYTALSLSELCTREGHQTVKVKAIKRFFRCKDCKNKCISLDRLPSLPCSKCGGQNFEQTGMMTEKKGPKTQELLLRGEERKFVSSL